VQQETKMKKRYPSDNPSWFRIKKLWLKLKILRGKGDIISAQKVAIDIQKCQEDLGLPKSDFTELLSIVLWE